MAYREIHAGSLTTEFMNSGVSYRVRFSYGTFSVFAKKTKSGIYYYIVKRISSKIEKLYLGRCGDITADLLHRATMAFSWQKFPKGTDYMPSKRGSIDVAGS